MRIELPDMAAQQEMVFQSGTRAGIDQLYANLEAPRLPPQSEIDEDSYSRKHLLRDSEGWEAPHPDIVGAYFRHFQSHFVDYNTDKKLAALLGLRGTSIDRRIRSFKDGGTPVPYGIWRHFLVLTGRVPQDVIPVLAFMG
ncbi:hypothetical protein PflA506_p0022 (plasmid) [Pseudomonas fluorescens A506]|nr:hypothetical protein PflA506_p0022 [Pseudomonas fluorescens A506]